MKPACHVISLKAAQPQDPEVDSPQNILSGFTRTFEQLDALSRQIMDSRMPPTDKCAIVGFLGSSAATIYQANLAYLACLSEKGERKT